MSATELNEFLTAMDIVREANATALSDANSFPVADDMLDEGSDWFDAPATIH